LNSAYVRLRPKSIDAQIQQWSLFRGWQSEGSAASCLIGRQGSRSALRWVTLNGRGCWLRCQATPHLHERHPKPTVITNFTGWGLHRMAFRSFHTPRSLLPPLDPHGSCAGGARRAGDVAARSIDHHPIRSTKIKGKLSLSLADALNRDPCLLLSIR